MAWRDFLPRFTNLIGIDLGTARTRIWSDTKGFVVDESTAIAVDEQGKVIAVGTDAAEIKGRMAEGIVVHQPLQRGKLFDVQTAKAMLRVWLQQILGAQYIFSPVVMVSVPATATAADKQAITELLHDLGAREAYTIAQPLAAAIGAGVPIADASGTLLFQMGAGVLEVAMISLGSIVAVEKEWRAGEYLDGQLQQLLKEQQGLVISKVTAEQLKQQVSLFGDQRQGGVLVTGQDMVTNAPVELEVPTPVIADKLLEMAHRYLGVIKTLLAKVPPELTSDILDKGMLLSGGLAKLQGLDHWLTRELGVPVSVVEDAQVVAIQGIAQAIEHREEFKQSLGYR